MLRSNSHPSMICCIVIFLTSVFVFVSCQDRDVGSFLNKLMREYVPKNTRHYTLYNGQPIYSGPEPQTGGDISGTLLSPSNNPLLNSIVVPEGASPFSNYGPWSSSSANAAAPTSSPSLFSSFFGRSVDSDSSSSGHEEMKAEEKSEIITIDNISQHQEHNDESIGEFKIQSSMSFQN